MLKGRDELVTERRRRIAAAWPKFKKLRRLARVLAYLPFIRLIAVCNTLAFGHGKPAADLDLFIITQSKRLWSARLLCVAAAKLCGGRPSVRSAKNKYCLSFYVSEDDLDIQRFVETSSGQDYYLTAWTSWVLPLYDAGGYTKQFADANQWVSKKLPQTSWDLVASRWRAYGISKTKLIVENAWPDAMEKFLEQLQRAYLPQALKDTAAKNTTSVVLDQTSLKFHLDDKRLTINKRYERTLATL